MCLPFLAPLGVALGASASSAAAVGTVTAGALAMGAASAGIGIMSQQQAAAAQNQYRSELSISQNRRYNQTVDSVRLDVGNQIDQLTRRQIQQQDAFRRELSGITNEMRAAQGTARAAMGGQGVEGNSVNILHNQFEARLGLFEATTTRNISAYAQQNAMEAKAIYSRGQSIINSGYPSPLPPPATVNVATSIMNGVTTGLSVFGSLQPFASGYGQTGSAGLGGGSSSGPTFGPTSGMAYNSQLQPWSFY